ncbi:MAG: recombination mediator RecR [Bdellovibrionota bacterium]
MTPPGDPIERLVAELSKLPGIGRKTAARLAFHILGEEAEYARSLAEALVEVKEKVSFCRECFNYAVGDLCAICSSPRRDKGLVCVVERVQDLLALEGAGGFGGVYHVLHGVLSPLDEVGPEEIRIQELLERVRRGGVREIVLATGTGVEGEATALYLSRELKGAGVGLSRIAYGVPIGGELEYLDRATLSRALEGRTRIG